MTEQNDIVKIQAAFDELQSINRLIEKICQVHETNHIMSLIINELVRLTGADEGVINLVSASDKDILVAWRLSLPAGLRQNRTGLSVRA